MQDKNSVKMGNGFKTFLGIVAVLILVALAGIYFSDDEISQADLDKAVSDAIANVETGYTQAELDKAVSDAIVETEIPVEEKKTILGYLFDELFLGTSFGDIFSDREINLFDGEIEFDGDDYDAEETFEIDGMVIEANEEDFEGVAYLLVPKDSISYSLVFEGSLETSLIGDEDETLIFNFLGSEVEVSKWDGDEITITKGEKYFMDQGQSITVGDKTVTLEFVLSDAVYVRVDGEGKKIKEGTNAATVGGIEIKISEVLYNDYVQKAELIIADEIDKVVKDGDEYEEDSIWEYVIDINSIGLVLNEEFVELDDDFKVLAVDGKLCLPNEYVCVQFNGLGEEDTEEISFELDTEDGIDYVEVNGNFQSGLEDYEKIYINATGIYDEDFDKIVGVIAINDFDSTISLGGLGILIKDFEVNLDLNISSVGDDDIDYLTDFGISVSNPEDSVEDQEWTIIVPENKLEGSLSLI